MTRIIVTKCGEQQQTVNDKKVTTRVVIKKSLNRGIMNYKNLYFY